MMQEIILAPMILVMADLDVVGVVVIILLFLLGSLHQTMIFQVLITHLGLILQFLL